MKIIKRICYGTLSLVFCLTGLVWGLCMPIALHREYHSWFLTITVGGIFAYCFVGFFGACLKFPYEIFVHGTCEGKDI